MAFMRLDRADLESGARFDRGTLASPTRTSEDYLVAEARIAKPGVLVYLNPDGSLRRELVLPELLASPESLASLAHKPVTLEHPMVGGRPTLITSETIKRNEVGNVTEGIRVDDDGTVIAKIVVRDAGALRAIGSGKREISAGYMSKTAKQSGIHPVYGEYDVIQTSRIYNHVALTDRPRGGADLRLRADREDTSTPAPGSESTGDTKREDTMNPLLVALLALGITQEVAEASLPKVEAAANAKLRSDCDDATARADSAEAKVVTLESEAEVAKARFDSIELDPDNDEHFDSAKRHEGFIKAHRERAELEATATRFNVDSADLDKPDADLRRAVLAKAKPELSLDGKSPEWIAAAVDMLPESTARADSAWERAMGEGGSERTDADDAKPKPNAVLKNYNDAHEARFAQA